MRSENGRRKLEVEKAHFHAVLPPNYDDISDDTARAIGQGIAHPAIAGGGNR